MKNTMGIHYSRNTMARKPCHSKNIAIMERWISFLRTIPTMQFYHRECFRLHKHYFRAEAGSLEGKCLNQNTLLQAAFGVPSAALYHRKVRNGTVKWVCSRHAADTTACNSGYYSEERIYDGIITMINKLRFCEEDILGQTIQKLEFAAAAYKRNNRAASQLSQSIAELNAKLLALERLRTKGYLAADIYHTQAREIRQQLDKLKTERYSSFESKILTMLEDVRKLKSLIDELEQPLEVFDEKLFHEIVTDICINHHDEMTVTLLGGLRFTEQI